MGALVGAACGGLIGLALVIGLVVFIVRKQRAAVAGPAAPCPKCGQSAAKPVTMTWWGGVLGPKLLSHVECASCGTAYNGKTGHSNGAAIALYVATTFGLGLVLVGVGAWLALGS